MRKIRYLTVLISAFCLSFNVVSCSSVNSSSAISSSLPFITFSSFPLSNSSSSELDSDDPEPDPVTSEDPVEPTDFTGKTMTFIGDSITAGTCASEGKDFVSLVGAQLGCNTVNLGLGGATMCTGLDGPSLLEEIIDYSEPTDYIFIALGSNDFWFSSDGEGLKIGDDESTDTGTLKGAFNICCEALNEKYQDTTTKVCIMTPITGYFVCNDSYGNNVPNSQGDTLRDYCNAIIEVSDSHSISCLDMNKYSGIYYNTDQDQNCDVLLADGVHPNDLGYVYMARTLLDYLMIKN
jgi:lysophospholipase L1-like esterase